MSSAVFDLDLEWIDHHQKKEAPNFRQPLEVDFKAGYNTMTLSYWRKLQIIGVSLEGVTNHLVQ